MSYDECPSCGASDGQGCYSECPTVLQERVNELEREVQWHKVNSARRGEVEAVFLRRVQRMEAALKNIRDNSLELFATGEARTALNPSQEPV